MEFTATFNGVTVQVKGPEEGQKGADGRPLGKPSPDQWLAFVLAVVEALAKLFGGTVPPAGLNTKPIHK